MDREARILILDDEVIASMALKMRLESVGYRSVYTASSHEGAMKLLREIRPAGAIVDINLNSEKSGLDFLRDAGNFERVIVLTGYGKSLYASELATVRFDAFLEKPVDLGAIVEALE